MGIGIRCSVQIDSEKHSDVEAGLRRGQHLDLTVGLEYLVEFSGEE